MLFLGVFCVIEYRLTLRVRLVIVNVSFLA